MPKYRIKSMNNSWVIYKYHEFKRSNLVIMKKPKSLSQDDFDNFVKSLKIQIG